MENIELTEELKVLYLKCIDYFSDIYDFLNISMYKIETFVIHVILDNPEYMYEELIEKINGILKENIINQLSKEKFIKLLIAYLPKNNDNNCLDIILKKLKEIDYELDLEQIKILLDNKKIYNLIKNMVDEYKNLIINNQIELISDELLIITLIELYCDKNSIMRNDLVLELSVSENKDLTNLGIYFNNLPEPLNYNEIIKLFNEYNNGNEQAFNIIFESNLRLVVKIAHYYEKRGLEFIDLIQEGCFGLIESIKKYDCTKGYKFSTFAYHRIRKDILRSQENKARSIRIPSYLYKKYSSYSRAKEKLEYELKRIPTIEELAEELNDTVENIKKIELHSNQMISLNKVINPINKTELSEVIGTKKYNPEKIFFKELRTQEIISLINKCLTKRDAEILKYRFGFITGKKEIIRVIGEKFNLTHQRINQIEKNSLEKMKNSRFINKKEAEKLSLIEKSIIKYILSLNELDKKIMLLYLGYYKGHRLLKQEKISLLNLERKSIFVTHIEIIKNDLKVVFPNIDEIFYKIRVLNCEYISKNRKENLNNKKEQLLNDLIVLNIINEKLKNYEFLARTNMLNLSEKKVIAVLDSNFDLNTIIDYFNISLEEFMDIYIKYKSVKTKILTKK